MAAPGKAKKLKKRIEAIKFRNANRRMDPLSQDVRDFCRPVLAVAPELNGPENAVGLGVFAWNAAFLPEERWRANLRLSLARFNLGEDGVQALEEIVEEMIHQKSLMFPGDKRVVTSWDVRIVGPDVIINAKGQDASKTLMPSMKDDATTPAGGCPSATGAGGCNGCPSATPAGGCGGAPQERIVMERFAPADNTVQSGDAPDAADPTSATADPTR